MVYVYEEDRTHCSSTYTRVYYTLADSAPRNFEDASEWMLCKEIFFLAGCFGTPKITPFTTQLNQ